MDRKLDMEYLLFAWQDSSPDKAYYLDIESGDVLLVEQDLLDIDDLTDMIEGDHDRYLYIPKPDSAEARSDMYDFIAIMGDAEIKRFLTVAFESSDPVYACKTVLKKTPDHLKAWEEFSRQRVGQRVNEWLQANFILKNAESNPGDK